jgi:hypothetical protein
VARVVGQVVELEGIADRQADFSCIRIRSVVRAGQARFWRESPDPRPVRGVGIGTTFARGSLLERLLQATSDLGTLRQLPTLSLLQPCYPTIQPNQRGSSGRITVAIPEARKRIATPPVSTMKVILVQRIERLSRPCESVIGRLTTAK